MEPKERTLEQTPSPKTSNTAPSSHNNLNPRQLGWIGMGTGAMLIGLLAIGMIPRLNRQTEMKALAATQETSDRAVQVITPKKASGDTNLNLPGNVQAIQETTLYARSNGYLKRRWVDIGDRVKTGTLLAEIETPEGDQEVEQARSQLASARASVEQNRAGLAQGRADLQQAQANLELARQSWKRWQTLVQLGAVSQQNADERRATFNANLATVNASQARIRSDQANINAAQANLNSSQANLRRLLALQSFQRVVAPFEGVITARNVDAGALITAGSTSNSDANTSGSTSTNSSSAGLFRMARTDTLRIRVNVPQTSFQGIRQGQTAEVQVRELPKKTFTGKVARTADVLDPNSNTLLTEIQVLNQDNVLRPGMYAQVKFTSTRSNPPLLTPANTLVISGQGTQVATVTKQKTVQYRKVEIGRDYGNEVEINTGLNGNESLILNPTDDLEDGDHVQVAAAKS